MIKHWIIALGILSLEAQAKADFETLGACSGLYEAGDNMARWRAVQGIAEALGRQQQTIEEAYDAGWWFGMARGDWKELYATFTDDYGKEQAENWRQSAILGHGCELIGEAS